MTDNYNRVDTFRAILVLAAAVGTIAFNWLAATGRIGGVTPEMISALYPTPVTPAGYAFSIWSLIYLGILAFAVYQLLPANLARFRSVRSYFILSCALNCAWIYMWHNDRIDISFVIIVLLWASLFMINLKLRETKTTGEYWFARAPFELYLGWVTAASLVNFAVLLVYWKVGLSEQAWTWTAVVLILAAAVIGILIRLRLTSYFCPLAIAWALTAIGVKQSGHTLVVVATAVGTVACLIAAMSFVVNMPSSDNPKPSTSS